MNDNRQQPNDCLILDGGLATQLEARGHDLNTRLWSARLLRDDPGEIAAVHQDYLAAGADIITSASYQATLPGFAELGLALDEAQRLLHLPLQLALRIRDRFWVEQKNHAGRSRPLVAASVGPYGAYLANGSEYTGDYDLDRSGLLTFHRERWQILLDGQPDLLLCETIPSFAEAQALAELAADTTDVPVWISLSCRDEQRMNDGTPIVECARLLDSQLGIDALGVNCTAPKFVAGLIRKIRQATDKPIVVYPNSGESYDAQTKRWSGELPIDDFAQQAIIWHELGASIIGGCCRTTPAHIRKLRARLRDDTLRTE